ncbi:DUF3397 family protein [Levilactobacillus bambusae]|nr:DUF3397 family protein [Levilactobacillus bambusae]
MAWWTPTIQAISFILIFIVGWGIKRSDRISWPAGLYPLDLLPPFLLLGSLVIWVEAKFPPLFPILVIIWMLIGVFLTLYAGFRKGEILMGAFLKSFWRISDLYLWAMWVSLVIMYR